MEGSYELGSSELRSKRVHIQLCTYSVYVHPAPLTHASLVGANIKVYRGFLPEVSCFYTICSHTFQDETSASVGILLYYRESSDSWQRHNCYSSTSQSLEVTHTGQGPHLMANA